MPRASTLTGSEPARADAWPAVLTDGVTSDRREVGLLPTGNGLLLLLPDGQEERLAFGELLMVSDLPDRTVIGRRSRPDWRLVARPRLPERERARLRRARARPARTAALYLAVTALLLGGAALLWFRGGPLLEAAAPRVPAAITRPLGEAVVAQISGGRFCTSPEAAAALAGLAARLAPEGGMVEPITLRIADLPVANALAAPGGQVLLTRGLIAEASGPDEVAGVLAHELGHIQHRHATRMLLRNLGMSVLLGGSDIGRLSDTLLSHAMSRDMEREADAFALAALARAGVSPKGLVAFFERHQPRATKEGASGRGRDLFATLGTYASTHPPTPERLARFEAAARAARGALQPALDEAGWQALRAACGPGPGP